MNTKEDDKSEPFRESENHNKEVDMSEPFFHLLMIVIMLFFPPHFKRGFGNTCGVEETNVLLVCMNLLFMHRKSTYSHFSAISQTCQLQQSCRS